MTAQKREDAGELKIREQTGGFGPDAPREEVARYITDMVLQLRNMAKDQQMEFLAYLLEMAYQEAFDLSQQRGQGGD